MGAVAYCKLEQFMQIVGNHSKSPSLFNVIKEFFPLHLDIQPSDLMDAIQVNPFLKALIKREHAGVKSDPDAFELIESGQFDSFLNDLLVLEDDNLTKNVREGFGVLAVTYDDDLFKIYQKQLGYTINRRESCKIKSWSDVFISCPLLPANSALIIDNFLWKDLKNFHNENLENLYPILDEIVPRSLKVPFHLIIVIQNKNGAIDQKKAQEKLNKILKHIQKSTGISVDGAIVAQTDTKVFHERVIITNHHYIYSDKGFRVFKEGKVDEPTKGDRNFVFKDIDNYEGEIRKHQQLHCIQDVHEAISDSPQTSVCFFVGNINSPLFN